jgi:parvulin-like peptidyl-prolyl isomerase
MRRKAIVVLCMVAAAVIPAMARANSAPQAARVVDRIVARVGNDVILLSQERELAAFQQLVQGHAESDHQLLSELIEQWVVRNEANASHFPEPAGSEVDREAARIAGQFPSTDAYAAKLRQLSLSAADVRRLVAREIRLARYLDYKFRPAVRIEASQIHAYYQKQLLPELTKQHQKVPPETAVDAQIRELLTQKEINDRTAKWLNEEKARLKIETSPPGGSP